MSEENQKAEIVKHVKQLENQNHRLRRLLSTTLNVASQDSQRVSALNIETKSLENTVDNLEREKHNLEMLLTSVLSSDEGNINLTLLKLEREHTQLRSKLDEALTKIQKENEEIESLRSEDAFLKATIKTLEATKKSLMERIRIVEDKESVLSAISSKLKQHLSEIEQKEALIKQTTSITAHKSEDKVLSDFNGIEETYRTFVDTLKAELSETVCNFKLAQNNSMNMINVNSQTKLQNSITSIEMAETGLTGNQLFKSLEETILRSSQEIDHITTNVSDQNIHNLIDDFNIHKNVLINKLQLAKEESDIRESHRSLYTGSTSSLYPPASSTTQLHEHANENSEGTRSHEMGIADLEHYPAGVDFETIHNELNNSNKPSTSNGKQLSLDKMVSKLEDERSFLLKQLRSVSAMTAQHFEERVLQTQSELHNTFMREVSSEELVEGKNYDDATNQLYASEEAKLEQRIRELETENERIKKELENILQQIKNEQGNIQPEVKLILKQRIDELEKK